MRGGGEGGAVRGEGGGGAVREEGCEEYKWTTAAIERNSKQ